MARAMGKELQARRPPAVKEVDILWITAGLSCDGDSVSVTNARLPSIEDVLLGAIPGLPKVNLHNPVLAVAVGDDFMKPFWDAYEGRLANPFVLVVEGSIPNEKIKSEGYWAAYGSDPDTGQPITTCEWIDRLAPKATAVVAAGTCATYGGIHAMSGNPTGAMGLADYLGWAFKTKAGLPIVNVPGCPVQPDNFMETLLVVDGKTVTNDLVDINLGIRILLGSSYYDDWQNGHLFVEKDPLGNPVDARHPWNQTPLPHPQKRDFTGKYTWVMSPRWYDKQSGKHLALDTGGGPLARFWATALAGLVDIGYVKATGTSVKMVLPKTALLPEVELEWKIPKWSNAIERDRARTYFQAYAAACAIYFCERAMAELHKGNTATWTDFKVPQDAIGCGFHEAVRGVLSHHVVIRNGRIANYHPYPPTPWNASPRDNFGTLGPYEDAVKNTPIFEENGPGKFKGIDIMRAVRSFDPCLPCGVHMYLGEGKELVVRHSPAFGAQVK